MVKILINIFKLFIFTILLSCTTVKPIIGPDGTENQLVSCVSVEQCYIKAREVCMGNYKIINTSTDTSGSDGNTSTSIDLLVKCDK